MRRVCTVLYASRPPHATYDSELASWIDGYLGNGCCTALIDSSALCVTTWSGPLGFAMFFWNSWSSYLGFASSFITESWSPNYTHGLNAPLLLFPARRIKSWEKKITNGENNSLDEMDGNSFTYYFLNVIYLSSQEPLERYYKDIAAM